jgi:hypothetical protein
VIGHGHVVIVRAPEKKVSHLPRPTHALLAQHSLPRSYLAEATTELLCILALSCTLASLLILPTNTPHSSNPSLLFFLDKRQPHPSHSTTMGKS